MADKNNKTYGGTAKSVSEKQNYRLFESYSPRELISYIKELTKNLKSKSKEISLLEKEIEKQKNVITKLENELAVFYDSSDNLEKFRGYDPKWLYVDKICFVIERSRKPLNSQQIVDLMLKIEPELALRLLDPYNSITKAIYNAIKVNRLVKYKKTGNFGITYILSNQL